MLLAAALAGCSVLSHHDASASRGRQGAPTTPVPTISTLVLATSTTTSLLPAPSTVPAAFGPDRSPDALTFFHLAVHACPEAGLTPDPPAMVVRLDGDRYFVAYTMVPAILPATVPPLPAAPPPPPSPAPTGAVLVDLGARQVTGLDGPEGRVPDPFRTCADHRLFAGNR